METGDCKLCLSKSVDLRASHFLPRSLYALRGMLHSTTIKRGQSYIENGAAYENGFVAKSRPILPVMARENGTRCSCQSECKLGWQRRPPVSYGFGR